MSWASQDHLAPSVCLSQVASPLLFLIYSNFHFLASPSIALYLLWQGSILHFFDFIQLLFGTLKICKHIIYGFTVFTLQSLNQAYAFLYTLMEFGSYSVLSLSSLYPGIYRQVFPRSLLKSCLSFHSPVQIIDLSYEIKDTPILSSALWSSLLRPVSFDMPVKKHL